MSAEQKQLSAAEKKEREDQLTCIDPNNSVVVTSCAGSGKTWLLTSRIIRIILENAHKLAIDAGGEQGSDDSQSFRLSSILAITFTNNAAAEIEKRVREYLRDMAAANEEELEELLESIGVKGKYTSADIKNAYRKYLLARPPLSVFTFHSWFNHLINYLPWGMRPNLNSRLTENPKHLKALAWQETLMEIRDAGDETEAEQIETENKIRRLAEEAAISLRSSDASDDEMRALVKEARSQLLEEKREAPKAMRLLLGLHSLPALKDFFDKVLDHRADWFLSHGCLPEEIRAYKFFAGNIEHSTPKPGVEITKFDLLEEKFLRKLNSCLCDVMHDYLTGDFAKKAGKKAASDPEFLATYEKFMRAASAKPAEGMVDERFLKDLLYFLEELGLGKSRVVSAITNIQTARWQNNPSGFYSEVKKYFLDQTTLGQKAKKIGAEESYKDVEEDLKAVAATEAHRYNKACARIGTIYARNYAQIKKSEGVIDYSDMEIFPLSALFINTSPNELGELNSDAMADLLLRLDNSYEHVLVDEFQDTNPTQWLMLKAWLHHSKRKPKVFIVGDPKQSIFSFRGSNPKLLSVAQNYIQTKFSGKPPISVNTTRRCSQSVVDLVNALFVDAENSVDSTEDTRLKLEGFGPHKTLNTAAKGSVTCLPLQLVAVEKKSGGDSDLRNPLVDDPEENEESSHYAMLEGAALSEEIKRIKSSDKRENKDFMLLHPTKTHAQALTDGLASHGLDCALIDKASRMSHLECQDVVAMLHAIFDPSYGLMVAQVLRSPIFGLDEEDLWRVFSAGRSQDGKRCDWFAGLANAAQQGGASDKLKEAHCSLDRWRTIYRQEKLPAHELLSRCYADAGIINRYAEKVPPEIAKRVILNLEWILNYSLEAMQGSLTLPSEYANHLLKLKDSEEDIAAAIEQEGVIQSLTVHSAKGLESPAVAIANCNYGKSSSGPRLLVHWDLNESDQKPGHFSFLRSPTATTDQQKKAVEGLEEVKKQEERNLLYVAMTRAKEHLIFSVMPKKKPDENPKKKAAETPKKKKAPEKRKSLLWWSEVDECLQKLCGQGASKSDGDVWRYVTQKELPKDSQKKSAKEKSRPPAEWPTKKDPPVPKILTKKKAPATEEMVRGTQLHNLLALELQGVKDESVQRRLLGIGKDKQKELMETVDEILDSETDFGKLLADKKEIECELPAVDEEGKSKRIDCLLTTKDDTVWVLDFKTGDTEKSEDDHNKQLRGYYQIVKHHHKKVRLGIIDSEGALREVPTK